MQRTYGALYGFPQSGTVVRTDSQCCFANMFYSILHILSFELSIIGIPRLNKKQSDLVLILKSALGMHKFN